MGTDETKFIPACEVSGCLSLSAVAKKYDVTTRAIMIMAAEGKVTLYGWGTFRADRDGYGYDTGLDGPHYYSIKKEEITSNPLLARIPCQRVLRKEDGALNQPSEFGGGRIGVRINKGIKHQPLELSPEDLFILPEDLEKVGANTGEQSADHPELFISGGDQVEMPMEPAEGGEPQINKGGSPPSPLRQVIEAEYPYLSQGQNHPIDVDVFGKHLACLLGQEGSKDKGTRKRSVFANERIKTVKGKGPSLKIITQEYQELKGKGKKTTIESKSYNRKALQDIVRAVHKKAQKHGVKKVS